MCTEYQQTKYLESMAACQGLETLSNGPGFHFIRASSKEIDQVHLSVCCAPVWIHSRNLASFGVVWDHLYSFTIPSCSFYGGAAQAPNSAMRANAFITGKAELVHTIVDPYNIVIMIFMYFFWLLHTEAIAAALRIYYIILYYIILYYIILYFVI